MPENEQLFKDVISQYKQIIFWMATAFSTVTVAISFVTIKWMKSKDSHIKDKEADKQALIKVIESVAESNTKIANAIDSNTTATEANTKASEKQSDRFNDLHLKVLEAMGQQNKKRKK